MRAPRPTLEPEPDPCAHPSGSSAAARCRRSLLPPSLALAGCDTAEERAEAHYQRGMALLAAGDADRALVEFRNVFKLDGEHIPARLAYAGVERERGETREAIGQYLRVADQDPANLEAQRAAHRDRAADAGFRHRRGACRGGLRPGPGRPRRCGR